MTKKITLSACLLLLAATGTVPAFAAETQFIGDTGAAVAIPATYAGSATCEDLGITRTLKKGSRGDMVDTLQMVLVHAGYLDEETGLYDTATLNAVKDFQKEMNLKADGVFGPKSRAAMAEMCDDVAQSS